MKKLKDEDDYKLLEKLRTLNADVLNVNAAVLFILMVFLWHLSKIAFWILLIVSILIVASTEKNRDKLENAIEKELRERGY